MLVPALNRRLVLVVLLVVGIALVVLVVAPDVRSGQKVEPGARALVGAPGALPVINIAHRGSWGIGKPPENTLAAYSLAAEQGAHVIETDATLTADRQVVAFHDLTLTRLTDAQEVFPGRGFYRVEDFTLDELRLLTVGTWDEPQRIPTLHEVIDLARSRGVGVLIDMKPDHSQAPLEPAVIAVLDALNDPDWVNQETVITGFFDGSLQETRQLLAELELYPEFAFIVTSVLSRDGVVLAVGPEPTPGLIAPNMTLEQVRDQLRAAGYAYLGLGLLGTQGEPANDFTTAEVDLFRAGGIELNFFTNDSDEMRHFIELGVSSILTDYPERLTLLLSPAPQLGR